MGCSGQTLWQDRVRRGLVYSAIRCVSPTFLRAPILAWDFILALEGFTTSRTSTFQTFQGSTPDSLVFSDKSRTRTSPGSSVSSTLKRAVESTANSFIGISTPCCCSCIYPSARQEYQAFSQIRQYGSLP